MYSSNACGIIVVVIDGQMRTSRTTIICFVSIVETERPFLSGVHTVLSAFVLFFVLPPFPNRLSQACVFIPVFILVPSFAFPRRSFSFSLSLSMTGWCSYWSIHVFVFLQAIDKRLTISQANEHTFSDRLSRAVRMSASVRTSRRARTKIIYPLCFR